MVNDMESDSSGKPNYELNIQPTQKTASSTEKKFEDKTIVSYGDEDVEKYRINKPKRDKIYAKIFKREDQLTCVISKETKTTE